MHGKYLKKFLAEWLPVQLFAECQLYRLQQSSSVSAIQMAMRSYLRRGFSAGFMANSLICSFCSEVLRTLDIEKESKPTTSSSASHPSQKFLPSLLEPSKIHSDDFKVELVDSDSWHVSSGLSESWRRMNIAAETQSSTSEAVDEHHNFVDSEPDMDEIEDMRIRENLFYKLDKDSREFEEYNFDFHRRKSSKTNEDKKEKKRTEKMKLNSSSKSEEPSKRKKPVKNEPLPEENVSSCDGKKLRSPTFNQLTGPYHEPFCLDIYISKSSVRACIVHRVTSKVVVVAHSISKDMKFDLSSTKNYSACVAVGGVLAQRALADDIHDVVYTPRKGEKVEGKLETVLQCLIDNGIYVKVKIKQRNPKKAASYPSRPSLENVLEARRKNKGEVCKDNKSCDI